jgi:PPK2 family polyphosphate:nucleotide phosphotransferase
MTQPLSVKPGKKIDLNDFDPADTGGFDKEQAIKETAENVAKIDELSFRFYAERRRALLLVLQGTDTSGKDGLIRRVIAGIDPIGCQVTAFKQPSLEELDHDFLWRIARALPRRGDVGIFNRSHYEDVLVARVRKLVPEDEWKSRFERINQFERLLTEGGTTIVKCFLHISKEEQRQRLQKRIDDPTRRWKFDKGDLADRAQWKEYQQAYEDALTRCNTEHAPWHIIPADHKWRRDQTVSRLLRETFERLNPQFPPAEPGLEGMVVE